MNRSKEFRNLKFEDLISSDQVDWNQGKLMRFLAPIDVEIIQRVKIQGLDRVDRMYWMLDKLGRFSIKSVYWLLKDEDLRSRPGTSLGLQD